MRYEKLMAYRDWSCPFLSGKSNDVFIHCYKNGALTRITGDVIALSPPLIIEKDQIDELIEILRIATINVERKADIDWRKMDLNHYLR